MPLPEPADIRAYLEGYGVTVAIITDDWITARRDNLVVPVLKGIIGYDFVLGETLTEYLSGNGQGVLMLSRRPITALVTLSYTTDIDPTASLKDSVEVNLKGGMLIAKGYSSSGVVKTSIFSKGTKNIKAVYTVGGLNDELTELITYQVARKALVFVAARTGGGDVNSQAFSRAFGSRGKYTTLLNEIDRDSHAILSRYTTGVVGP